MSAMEESLVPHLAAVPLFSSLSRRQLEAVGRAGKVRSYAAGETIVARGDHGIGFYLVLEGRVEVRADGRVIAALSPGEFFGEMALFADEPRTADVVASVRTQCLVLSRWEFWGEMSREPEVLRVLMAELVHRLRSTPHALKE